MSEIHQDAWTCKVCDHQQNDFPEQTYMVAGVCSKCVEWLANEYWKAHSGDPHPDFASDEEWEKFKLIQAERKKKNPKQKQVPRHIATKVFERDRYRCVMCETHKDLTIDHIHPLAKGGTDDLDNLQTLCKSCNCSKGARV